MEVFDVITINDSRTQIKRIALTPYTQDGASPNECYIVTSRSKDLNDWTGNEVNFEHAKKGSLKKEKEDQISYKSYLNNGRITLYINENSVNYGGPGFTKSTSSVSSKKKEKKRKRAEVEAAQERNASKNSKGCCSSSSLSNSIWESMLNNIPGLRACVNCINYFCGD